MLKQEFYVRNSYDGDVYAIAFYYYRIYLNKCIHPNIISSILFTRHLVVVRNTPLTTSVSPRSALKK